MQFCRNKYTTFGQSHKMKLAIVGCTGLVGKEVLNVLSELSVPVSELILVASKKNIGKKVAFKNEKITIVGIQEAIDQIPEIAIFCAGSKVSKKWAQKFVDSGTSVIDNSSFFRMEENIPLVVPRNYIFWLKKYKAFWQSIY